MAPTLTPRQTFREVLTQAAAQAKLLLPPEVNGRIESAVRLVLLQDVVFNADGTATVGSSSDPMKTYTLAGSACDCQDFVHGKGTEGWCQHRIAANLLKSVERVLARRVEPEPEPEVELPAEMEVWSDNDPELEEVEMPPTPVAPLPEAPVSITLKATLHGHEVLVTLRGTDFASVRTQVEEASAWLQAQTPPAHVVQGQGWCAVHQVTMKLNHKDGREWYSHSTTDGWCKGR
jgi:hypothetical protein